MARYKVTKDQLERIVENFVMEASIESKKASTKDMIPSQAADAKKHVKNKMSGNMVDQSEGMPSVTPMKKKHSQAAEAKKHMSKASTKHTNKAKVVKEEEESETDHMDIGSGMETITSSAVSPSHFAAAVIAVIAIVGVAWWKTFRNTAKATATKKFGDDKADQIINKIDQKAGIKTEDKS